MKVENWRSKLLAVIDTQERRSFAYGRDDCLMHTAEAVQAMTGVDYAEEYRGKYKSLAGAYKILKKKGFDTTLGPVAELFPEIHGAQACDGDIAAIERDGHWCFGVIIGAHFIVTTETGSGLLPRSAAQKFFRVE